jgi:hypothetical protein
VINAELQRYDKDVLVDGFNTMAGSFLSCWSSNQHYMLTHFTDGERVFFVSNPALGLWSTRARFQAEPTGH